jgi:hypothetical protein
LEYFCWERSKLLSSVELNFWTELGSLSLSIFFGVELQEGVVMWNRIPSRVRNRGILIKEKRVRVLRMHRVKPVEILLFTTILVLIFRYFWLGVAFQLLYGTCMSRLDKENNPANS